MKQPQTFAEIINAWPTVAEFARDMDILYPTASAMRRRGSIDADYWPKLLEIAPTRDIKLSWESLAKMAAGVAVAPEVEPASDTEAA